MITSVVFIIVICVYSWENGEVEATQLVGGTVRMEIQGDSTESLPSNQQPPHLPVTRQSLLTSADSW